MKRFLPLLILPLLFWVACEDESEGESEGEAPIYGLWEWRYYYNDNRHQYKNSECGMYCLYFIIQMLTTNKSFENFSNNKIHDKKMIRLRKKYFNQ